LDENKKPGARDISDLKARLGLKKTGVMPAVTPSGAPVQPGQPVPPTGQVPSPTAPKAIPSPFGQPEPEPAAPAAPPDPRRDPFAQQQAANLAAFYGLGQQLPGSTEGVSADIGQKPKPWGMIGVLAGVGAAVFGLGNACGRIYQSRAEFNMTIDQAGQIRTEVEKMSKNLNKIADVINASRATAQGQPDFDMTMALGTLDLAKPDTQKIFHTNYMHFEDPAIERLFNYYNHTITLYDMITQHAKRTDADRPAIENYQKNGEGKGNKNYAVILDNTGQLKLAKFAELGAPVCPNPDDTNCPPAQLKGFKYRFDSGGNWGEKPVKGNPTDMIWPIEPSALFKSIAAGNPDILAYKDYFRRIVGIKALAGSLVAEQKDVLGDLKKTAERPKVFVF
jgi:hypothetical protein